MLEGMSIRQFYRWMEYDKKHPFGDLRTEVEFARLKTLLGTFVSKNPPELVDFLWSFRPSEEELKDLKKQNVADKVFSTFSQVRNGHNGR